MALTTYSNWSCFFWMRLTTWSNWAAKRLRQVRMAPFGPSEYDFITFLYLTLSLISMLHGYWTSRTAGSKFKLYVFLPC